MTSLFQLHGSLHLVRSDKELQALYDHLGVLFHNRSQFPQKKNSGKTQQLENDVTHERMTIVMLSEHTSELEVSITLVHETVHVLQYELEYIREHNPSVEFQAYATENIYKYLVAEYMKTRFKKGRRSK